MTEQVEQTVNNGDSVRLSMCKNSDDVEIEVLYKDNTVLIHRKYSYNYTYTLKSVNIECLLKYYEIKKFIINNKLVSSTDDIIDRDDYYAKLGTALNSKKFIDYLKYIDVEHIDILVCMDCLKQTTDWLIYHNLGNDYICEEDDYPTPEHSYYACEHCGSENVKLVSILKEQPECKNTKETSEMTSEDLKSWLDNLEGWDN